MLRKPVLTLITVLVLAAMACSITVNIPVDKVSTGPTQTEKIEIPEPDAQVAEVSLTFGAGELRLSPGADGVLISGEATYNVDDFKPKIKSNGAEIRLETGDLQISGLPNFEGDIKNKWDLKFGDMPTRLLINAGAYEGIFELGGLSLESLEINDGAADVSVKFSEQNKAEMDVFRYITGASNVKLTGLSNANFASMIFRSGAGDYSLDFSGQLQRDAVVTIESGISHVVIIVPKGMAARVNFKGGLANVDISDEWQKSGSQYVLEGNGPVLTFNIDMGAGALELKTE